MTTLTLKYDAARNGFDIGRTGLFVPAASHEGDNVAEYLGSVLRDNPRVQYALGVVGARVVRFKIAKARGEV